MPKAEISIKCNDGTRYKVSFDRRNGYYVLYYRNDLKPLLSITGDKVKGKWLYLESQHNYGDVLDFLCEEIKSIDAIDGV